MQSPELNDLIQHGFYAITSLVTVYIANCMRNLLKSVRAINVRMATVKEKLNWHERIIDKQETRLIALETASKFDH